MSSSLLTLLPAWILSSVGEYPVVIIAESWLNPTISFSTVPAGVRSYVGGALAVAASGPSAGSSGDFISTHILASELYPNSQISFHSIQRRLLAHRISP